MEIIFFSNMTLNDKARIAIVSSLWNRKNISRDIKDTFFKNYQNHKKWSDIVNDVLLMVEKMVLPTDLKSKLKDMIQPMGEQILHWIYLTQQIFRAYSNSEIILNFIWTQNGCLDYIKTAETVIMCNSSYENLCFALACSFCMRDSTLNLKDLASPSLELPPLIQYYYDTMGIISSCTVKDDTIDTIVELVTALSNDLKSTSVLGYFLDGLSPPNKRLLVLTMLKIIFRKTRPREGNMLIFLFSHLEKSEIDSIISKNTYQVLSCFLEWPSQEFFLSLSNYSWQHLSKPAYQSLLLDLAECVSQYHMSTIYKKIFTHFWRFTPVSFKKYIESKCILGSFVSRLFEFENDDIVKIIFKDLSGETRNKLIFYHENMKLCDFLVRKERWISLKILIFTCIPTAEVLSNFIYEYKSFIPIYNTPGGKERMENFIETIKKWY